MPWRTISAIIVLFWAVMTGLVIRDAYFPDSSRFAVVPPRLVFDLFLAEAGAFNNQLHLYHDQDKIGHAHFAINRRSDEQGLPVYALLASGSFAPPAEKGPAPVTAYHLSAELENGERWRSFQLQTKTSATDTTGTVHWKRGDAFPQIEVTRGGEVILNSATVQAMMALRGGLGSGGQFPFLSQLGASGAADPGATVRVQAREGLMELAGKTRRCNVITAGLADTYEVRFYFTEVGELARIEMPGGYRFIEPLMHGLEPGLNTLE